MNGQTPLIEGDKQYPISIRLAQSEAAAYPNAPPTMRLIASDGSDITAQTTTGQLGSLLDTHNRVLASYLGDGSQAGDLNRLATALADRINNILTSGNVSDGPPAQPGIPVFTSGADPTSAASTVAINPSAKPELLGAIQPGPPYCSNGVPLALAALASPNSDLDRIDGASFTQFYGRLAARAGSELNEAAGRADVAQSAAAQAKNLRDQSSGVSLDEEAAILIQFQRAYEANSRLIAVLDRLSEDTIAILQR
jgi:flagellar hook-associated protein 1 FlgK